jgi:hypothetical protein
MLFVVLGMTGAVAARAAGDFSAKGEAIAAYRAS